MLPLKSVLDAAGWHPRRVPTIQTNRRLSTLAGGSAVTTSFAARPYAARSFTRRFGSRRAQTGHFVIARPGLEPAVPSRGDIVEVAVRDRVNRR